MTLEEIAEKGNAPKSEEITEMERSGNLGLMYRIKKYANNTILGLVASLGIASLPVLYGGCGGEKNDFVQEENHPCVSVQCSEDEVCALTDDQRAICVNQQSPNYRSDHESDAGLPSSSNPPGQGSMDRCLDERTLQSSPPKGKEFFIQECPEGTYCRESACRTVPGGNDPSCSTGVSACRVTDTYDVIEELRRESADFSSSYYSYSDSVIADSCGEDAGFRVGLSDSYWMAHTLRILPPPEGNGYYRLDFKMNWEGECQSGPPCCREYEHDFVPSMKVLFGDDQRVDYSPTEKTRECIFAKIADFTTAGISGSSVRINVEGNPATECIDAGYNPSRYSGIVIDKTRIWSCWCENE